jgi:hypothetical protein
MIARSPVSSLLTVTSALFLLAAVLGACSTRVSPSGAGDTPIRLEVVTAATPMGPPAPTKAPAATISTGATPQRTAAPTVPAGPVAWTLTILHTGEVYGDVLPCG